MQMKMAGKLNFLLLLVPLHNIMIDSRWDVKFNMCILCS